MGKRKTAAIVTCASLLSIGVGLVVGYFVFGNTTAVDQNGNPVVTATVICDDGIISRYNDATLYKIRGEDAQPAMDSAALKALASDVKSKDGHEDDPTCQAVVFWNAIDESDYDTASSAYDAIKRLHNQSKFVDNNMRIAVPLFEYESVLDTISPTDSIEEGAGGGGR